MNSSITPFKDENIVYSKGSEYKPVENHVGFYAELGITDNTPGAKSFASATDIDINTDIITEVGHGYLTGLVGQMTSSSALPTGLSLATNYYIIKVNDDSYKLASSLANALANTAINITGAGTGDQTFTPVALSGATVKLQGTGVLIPVEADWQDIADSSVSITGTEKKAWNVSQVYYSRVRYYVTLSSGQLDISSVLVVKGA